MASIPEMPEDSSPLAWLLVFITVFGIPFYAFMRLGGLKFVRRRLGLGGGFNKEVLPTSQRGGYIRVEMNE